MNATLRFQVARLHPDRSFACATRAKRKDRTPCTPEPRPVSALESEACVAFYLLTEIEEMSCSTGRSLQFVLLRLASSLLDTQTNACVVLRFQEISQLCDVLKLVGRSRTVS